MYLTCPIGYLGDMGTRPFDPAVGLNAAVAAVLEGERAAARMTLQELADVSGVSYRTLQRLLSSRDRHIDLATLDQLARAFRTTPERIIAGAQERMARGEHHSVDPDEAERAREVARRVRKKVADTPPARKTSRVQRRTTN